MLFFCPSDFPVVPIPSCLPSESFSMHDFVATEELKRIIIWLIKTPLTFSQRTLS